MPNGRGPFCNITSRMWLALSAKVDSVNASVATLTTKVNNIMSALSDLQATDATLAQSVTAAVADLQALSAALTAALANNDTAAIEAEVANLGALTSALNDAVTANQPPASSKKP